MKYTFRKIFIGVSIGIILMLFKSCEVKAWEINDTSKFRININSKFDVCTQQGSDYLCIDGFDYNYQWSPVEKNIYKLKTNEYIGLREFNIEVQQIDNGTYTLSNYIFVPGLWYYIGTQNDFNSLKANQYPISALIKTQDGIECSVSNMGIYGDLSFNNFSPYVQVPNECIGKNFDNIYLIYQPGYNFTGNITTIAHNINFDNIHSINDFIINRNNTYLALFTKTSSYEYIRQTYYQYGIYMNTSSSFTSSRSSQQNLTIADSEVQQKLNELNKEIYVASSWVGPDLFTLDNSNFFTTTLDGLNTEIADDLADNFFFRDFLNALISNPLTLLTHNMQHDFYNHSDNTLTGDLCFHSFQQGGSNPGWIPIPFKDTGNFLNDNFQLPCFTRDYYSKITKTRQSGGTFSILGNSSVDADSTVISYTGASFLSIWLLVQHFVLTYFLILSFLDLFKSSIDTKHSEIEVLEL